MIQNYKTHLSKKLQLTSDVWLYAFTLPEPTTLSFIPGQYLIMFVPQGSGEKARRLYSIASPNTVTNGFELLVKLIPNGCSSRYFEKLNVNDEVEFQGPAGMFTVRESSRNKIGLVTGTGYAPVRSMLLSTLETRDLKLDEEARSLKLENQTSNLQPQNPTSSIQHQASNFHLFFGFSYYKDIFLFEELKQLAEKNTDFKFYFCLSRELNLDMIPEENKKYFLLGRVTKGFDNLISNFKFQISNFDFYLCGGREVVEALKEYVYQKGVPKEQVYFEKF